MKNIKQLRAEVTEAVDTQANKLDVLVRSGLFEENKLTLLRRALDESNTKLTNHERKALQALSEKLIDALSEGTIIGGDYEEVLCETEEQLEEAKNYANPLAKMPPILVLKRKSIRVFGPGNTVAMYWSDDLQRYIAVPFEQTPILAEAEVAYIQQRGYQKLVNRANEGDPTANDELVKRRESLIKQYGREAFVKMHNSLVKRVPDRAKKMLKKVDDRIADETRSTTGNFVKAYKKSKSVSVAAGAALGGLVRKPFVKKEVEKLQSKSNSLRQTIKNRYLMPTIKENFSNRLKTLREEYTPWEQALDLASMAPIPFVGTAASALSLATNIVQGDTEDAMYDMLGLLPIPVVGGALRTAAKTAKTAAKITQNASAPEVKPKVDEPVQAKTNEPTVAKKADEETPEQRKAREQEEAAAKKRDEVAKKRREVGMGIAGSYSPAGTGPTGQQTAAATAQDGRPMTGFSNQVATQDPFANRNRGQAALQARIASAKRAALSEQSGTLSEAPKGPRGRSTKPRNEKNAAVVDKSKEKARKRDLLRQGLMDYDGSGNAGSDNFGWGKQRPQTGFARAITPEDSFARAVRAGYYDNPFSTGSVVMGKLNRSFMMKEGVLPELYNILKEDAATKDINIGNDSILVTKSMASSIVGLFESVNDENKAKLNKLLNEDTDKFYKVLDFAVRH